MHGSPGRPGAAPCLLAGLVMLGSAVPASAQTVHGSVVDETTNTPVALARVTALEGDSVVAGPITANAEGRFRLSLPGAGPYRLRVERLGYPVHTSLEFRVDAFESVEIEIRISPEPIPLAPLEVVARGPERGRDQFARRRASEDGHFVDGIHIALMREARRVRLAADMVRDVEGIRVSAQGRISTTLGWGCLVVFLDHIPIPVGYSPGRFSRDWPPRQASIDLNDAVDYRTIRGVEVYRSLDEVPQELRVGIRWQDVGRCGVVWFWTSVGW
jgi:hypothetical protein